MDIAEQILYLLKKYIGMGVADVRRPKILEEENLKEQIQASLLLCDDIRFLR